MTTAHHAHRINKTGARCYLSHWTPEKIRAFRQAHKLRQSDLSKMLMCRQQTISEWELGLKRMSRAYTAIFDYTTEQYLAGKRFDLEMADATA